MGAYAYCFGGLFRVYTYLEVYAYYRVFNLKVDFFNHGLEGSIFDQNSWNSKLMVLTRVSLIYFIKIEETFQKPLYFLLDKKWEINLICDRKHMKRDQGYQKIRVICIAFWLQIWVRPLVYFLVTTFRSPLGSVVKGVKHIADNPELLKSLVSFRMFVHRESTYWSP